MAGVWNSILGFISKIVSPDWGSLVGLLPLAILGPVVLFLMAIGGAWLWYAVRQPRSRPRVVEGPWAAALDESGSPVYPAGQPHCRRDGLVYPPGSTRCERCGQDLGVDCPMCGVGRPAAIDTCGNCGLILKLARRDRFSRPAGPPPGGAAIA